MVPKKVGLIVLIVVFLLSAGLSYSFFSFPSSNFLSNSTSNYTVPSTSNNVNHSGDSNEPKTEACPLNGQLYSKTQKAKWDGRRPLGIMVENHTEARPQSGISSADVVYEAVAEGGITRTLDIFFCEDAPRVGPVRSARIYFLRLIEGYGNNPLYAHVGGANTDGPADALGEIDNLGWGNYNDMNEFSVPFPNFWRDYELLPGVATEHTMYTTTAKLWDYAKAKRGLSNVDKKGIAWDKGFIPWKFKDDAPAADRGTVAKVDFGFWTFFASDYAVTWNYDKASNSYKRVNGGKPHLDKNTGKQLDTKNVVVVFAKESPANDGYEGGHILYKIIGTGDGLLFQDGKATKITWVKDDEASMLRFSDTTGKEVSLVRGQVFVEVLPTGNKVTY